MWLLWLVFVICIFSTMLFMLVSLWLLKLVSCLLWIIQFKHHIQSFKICSSIWERKWYVCFSDPRLPTYRLKKGSFQFMFLKASTHNWLTLLLWVCGKAAHHVKPVQQSKATYLSARHQSGKKGRTEGRGFESHSHLWNLTLGHKDLQAIHIF